MEERRADVEWLWYCCECGYGPSSALSKHCPSCQKPLCAQCAIQGEEPRAPARAGQPAASTPRPSKERRPKPKKGATKTGVAPNQAGATGTRAKPQNPPGGEAQPSCTRPRGGTPSSTRASSQFGSLANQGGSEPPPTTPGRLLDSPNGSPELAASANVLSIEPARATPAPGSSGPTSPHVPHEALLLSSSPHESSLAGPPNEPPPRAPDSVWEALPPLTSTPTLETVRTTSPPFSLDSYQDTPVPPSNPSNYYYPSYSIGNTPIGSSSPSGPLSLNIEPGPYSYDHGFFPDVMCLLEEVPTSSHPPVAGYLHEVSPPTPGKQTAHPSSQTATNRAPVDQLALAKQPKAQTGVSSKSPDRHCLPSKRKLEPTTIGDEGLRHGGFPPYDDFSPQQDSNLACPFYKMNPKQYMGCGERSIGNISALGQHLRQSHKLKPHSCKDCFAPFDDEASLGLHRERGLCFATGGCAVDDLPPVPRKCNGPRKTWLWYWNKLFPSLWPPVSPYTDRLDVIGQFALFAIQNVISPLDEPLRSELSRNMLMASKRWREDPSRPLDYSKLGNHLHSGLPADQDYAHQY